jgi:preprotein translocase subunit SecG
MQILANILLAFLIVDALFLILIVLMQRPKNEGLGAAFGGGVTEGIWGSQTTNVLVKATTYLGITFFVLALGVAALNARIYSPESEIQKGLRSLPAPEKSATPAPTAAASPSASAIATPEPVASPAASAAPMGTSSPTASSGTGN